jgi:hypothetical protein
MVSLFQLLPLELFLNIEFTELVANHGRQIHAVLVCDQEPYRTTTPGIEL